MAKTGNHGQIIPRDRELLFRLYWTEGATLPELGQRFDTTHKSVERVMRELGIPRRGLGARPKEFCIDCHIVRPKKLHHKLTKNGTGTRCHECLKKYKRKWADQKAKRAPEEVRAKKAFQMERWKHLGSINPKGESQWITKAKHLLQTNKRLLAGKISPARLQFLSEASGPEPISQT